MVARRYGAVPWTEALALLGRRRRLMAAAGLLTVGAASVVWVILGGRVRAGLAAASADPPLLSVLGTAFAGSLAATAYGWRLAFSAVGARVGPLDACASYALGSLVNTVSPARLGDGLRAALFARALPSEEGRALAAASALAAIATSRALVGVAAIAAGAAIGAVPLWPAAGLATVALAVVATALALGRTRGSGRFARLAEATVTLVRRPRLGLGLVGWSLVAVTVRLTAAAALASAFGVASPLLAALAITAALDVAAAIPIVPGGIGLTSGAITIVLASRGVAVSTALTAGLVFHVVETGASLAFAGVSLSLSASPRLVALPAVRIGVALALAGFAAVATSSVLDLA